MMNVKWLIGCCALVLTGCHDDDEVEPKPMPTELTVTTADDVTVEHVFYKVIDNVPDGETFIRYTLPVKSHRYAIPITNMEITRSGNQIVQNTYLDGDVRTEVVDNYDWIDVYEGADMGNEDWGDED
jgi:hypothetical protein